MNNLFFLIKKQDGSMNMNSYLPANPNPNPNPFLGGHQAQVMGGNTNPFVGVNPLSYMNLNAGKVTYLFMNFFVENLSKKNMLQNGIKSIRLC
jgi:hypothetical protein